MSVGMERVGDCVRAGLVRWKRSARWLGRRPVLWGLVAAFLLVDLMGVPAVTNNTAFLMPLCFASNRVGRQTRIFNVIERSTGWEFLPFESLPNDLNEDAFERWHQENTVRDVIFVRRVHSYGLVAPVFVKRDVTLTVRPALYSEVAEAPERVAEVRAAVIEILASGQFERDMNDHGLEARRPVDGLWLEMLRADIKEQRAISWGGLTHDCLFVLGVVWVLTARRWVMLRKKINKRERAKKRSAVWGGSVGTDSGNGAEGANR